MSNKTTSQYQTVEWHFENTETVQNPFDVLATALFTHEKGEIIQTGLFYNSDQKWTLRFTGTKPGQWTFTTTSDVSTLNNHTGTISVTPDSNAIGFVTHQNNKWARQRGNTLEAFLPIDTQKPYQEIDLGTLPKAKQTWQAPYTSDWAIAVSKP